MTISKLFNLWYLSGTFQLNADGFSMGPLAEGVCCTGFAFLTGFSASLATIIGALVAPIAACVILCLDAILFFCAFLKIFLFWDYLYWASPVLFLLFIFKSNTFTPDIM